MALHKSRIVGENKEVVRTRTELPSGRNWVQVTSLIYLLNRLDLEPWGPSDGLNTEELKQNRVSKFFLLHPFQQQLWRAVVLLGCNAPSSPDTCMLGQAGEEAFPSICPSCCLLVSFLDHRFQITSLPWLFYSKWPVKNCISEKDPATNHCQAADMSFLQWSWNRYVYTRSTKKICSSSPCSIFSSWPMVISVHKREEQEGSGEQETERKIQDINTCAQWYRYKYRFILLREVIVRI